LKNFKCTGGRSGNASHLRSFSRTPNAGTRLQTGGVAADQLIDGTRTDQAFNQISAELSQQYILNYTEETNSNESHDLR